MALRSFGKVAVASAGTPVRVTTNESDPTARVGVQSITVQAAAGNTGTNIYLGSSTMNKSTLAGVYLIISKGTTQQLSIVNAPAGINANELYLDADTSNDYALVSATEQ